MRQAKPISRNMFTGGMRRDDTPEISNNISYYYALNAMKSTSEHKGFGIVNEGSNKFCNTTGNIVGEHYLEERNQRILLKEGDEFWLFDEETCKEHLIFKASEFGCSFGLGDCEWHEIESATLKSCNETYIYFSSKCEYYNFNLDEMLDLSRKEGLKQRIQCEAGCASGCDVFKIMQSACSYKANARGYRSGGGRIPAGAYQFVARYINQDGGYTNWFNFTDPVYVGSENNIAGEPGNGHIEIQFSCLDCRFNKIEVAVLARTSSVPFAKSLGVKNYADTKLSINYTGDEGTSIDYTEILLKGETYLQGKSLMQRDGRMYYYRLKERNNLNYQSRAMGIEISYVVYEMPYDYARKHNIKSLMRGETYAFAIVWNYEDGTHSVAYHIPGTPFGSAVGNASSDYNGSGDYKPGVGGSSTRRSAGSSSDNSEIEVVCEFDFEDNGGQTLLTSVKQNSLQLFSDTSSEFIECAIETLRRKGQITICLVEDENEIEFVATSISGFDQNNYVKFIGSLEEGMPFDNAREVDIGEVKCIISTGGGDGGVSGGMGSGGGGESQATQPTPSITQDQCVVRKRQHKKIDDVNNPQTDDFDDELQNEINQHNTVETDLTEEARLHEDALQAQCCLCKDGTEVYDPVSCGPDGVLSIVAGDVAVSGNIPAGCAAPFVCCPTGPECPPGKAVEQSADDHPNVDEAASDWMGMLASYLKDDLNASPDMASVSNIKDAAKLLMDRIQDRERIWERKKRKYNISKTVSYGGGAGILKNTREESTIGTGITDCCGSPETEVEIRIVSAGKPTPQQETNILYPCSTDCDGNPYYGGGAGSPVTHSKFPDASQEVHYVSKSIGVPSELTPEADEYSDGYVRIMGPRFTNIVPPSDEESPIPICKNNPYTIVMVKRTDTNKRVILKGLATSTFDIQNNGKSFHQPKHGVNSRTFVSRYHDEDGCRRATGSSGNSFNLYSLDGLVREPALNADLIRNEGQLDGIGYRHRLYSKGEAPKGINEERVDNLGAVQAVNLNQWTPQGGELGLDFKIYAEADSVTAPPPGGSTPLNNKFQQHNIWFGAGLPDHNDDSFLGDVLDHASPIESATGNYVSFVRDLEDQYGNLSNLSYIPILWAGKQDIFNGTIEGPTGDVFIGPYSFVKTGYVSDKVGRCEPGDGCTAADSNKFNIPAQVPIKNERRCICDGPDDIIKQYAGLWLWTDLPEDGDAADPKNWAGTHTTGSRTLPHSEAVGSAALSDMYFPKTVKTLITYWGEFEVNPRMREKTDDLRDQWYPEIKEKYRLHNGSSVDGTGHWGDSYLSQFFCKWTQPSEWKRIAKAAIRGLITVIFPIWGIDNTFDVTTGMNLVGNLVEYPFMVMLWYLLNQVLYKNDAIDKLLNIPVCKSDEIGTDADACVQGFFRNYNQYNFDYSAQNDYYVYSGMPDDYYTCVCNQCDCGEYSNAIYYSDEQLSNSDYNAYKHIRPNNYVNLPANAGKLTNLFSLNGGFYAHTTDAIWQLIYGRTAIAADTGTIILGTGDLLQNPQTPSQGIVEGYAGLQYHNAAINTQFGYFFVDADANKIYRFHQGLEEISAQGMFNYFQNKLGFCECTKCVDQKKDGTSFYSLGIDPRHNRFLITKNEPNEDRSFTLSYDLVSKTWLSFHSYTPRAYFWSRKEMYSLMDGIWKHNESCDFQTFYGDYYPHEIEFTATPEQTFRAFEFQEGALRTEAEKCHVENCSYIKDIDHTFNKIHIRNTTQTTGTLEVILLGDDIGDSESANKLIREESKSLKLHKSHREYNFNAVHDHRLTDCRDAPLTTCKECEPFDTVIEFECSPENKKNYYGKVMEDDHITYRLTLDDGKSDIQLKTIYMDTFGPPIADNQQPYK